MTERKSKYRVGTKFRHRRNESSNITITRVIPHTEKGYLLYGYIYDHSEYVLFLLEDQLDFYFTPLEYQLTPLYKLLNGE